MTGVPPTPAGQPQPDDLPQPSGEPFAGLPPALRTPHRADGAPEPMAVAPPPMVPAAAVPNRIRPGVAVLGVLSLVGVVALTVWQLRGPGTPTTPPSALPSATASSSQPGATTATPSRSVPVSTDHPPALTAFYTQQVAWKPCADNPKHECATVEVPVDYAAPSGDRFELAVRRVPALDPAKRLGSLLINPGGPGGSGLEYAQYASFVFSKQLRASYDIIGFDPRGIGASSPVTCLTDADMDLLFSDDPTPDTAAERTRLFSDVKTVAQHCAAKGGKRALHMSSTEVARDMDVIRALVGDRKLNYFGVSYGTFLGALYADLYPQRVGRFVLDSAMSPNQTDAQEMTYDIQGFESSIDAFIDWCVARTDCSLGRDKAKARGRIVTLLDTVDRTGLATSKPGLPRIGEGWVGFAIFMCLYSDTSWPTLNKGLEQAFAGKGDILLARAMSVVGRDASGDYDPSSYLHAMLPVRCADWPRTTETAALKAEQDAARRAHPLWSRMSGEIYDNCAAWPAPGRTPKGGELAVGAAPILVIGNLRDPATPIGGTKQLAKDLESGVLVTSDHDGHGTYYAGNSCVDSVVDDYMVRGSVPPDGKAC